jgi:hypothetical protein
VNRANKRYLALLLDKPRAYRNALIAPGIPVRQAMIMLGADAPTTFEIPRNYQKLRENRKHKNDEPLF